MHEGVNKEKIFEEYKKKIEHPQSIANLINELEKEKQALLDNIFRSQQSKLKEIQEKRQGKFKEISLSDEGAMDWGEITRSVYVMEMLKLHYQDRFLKAGGADPIIDEIIQYINQKKQFSDRQFNPADPADTKMLKSAARCLIEPAVNTEFKNYLNPGAPEIYGAGFWFNGRDMLSFRWLAATDPTLSLEQQIDEKNNILHQLADIRRAHNGEPGYHSINDPIDDTSCPPGVIGRMEQMHIHNPVTAMDDITPSANHFTARYQVFTIEAFKKLSPLTQIKMVNALKYLITNLEETPDYSAFTDFITSMQSESALNEYIRLLEEFGSLDDLSYRVAVLIFFLESTKNKSQLHYSLLERLEKIAKGSLIKYLKSNVDLIQNPQINSITIELNEILKEAQRLKKTYPDYLHKEQALLAKVELISTEHFKSKLEDIKLKYQSVLFTANDVSDDESCLPYWFQKFELNFEEADYQAKLAMVTPQILNQYRKHASSTALTPNEMKWARDYMMHYARHPEKIHLKGFLNADSLIEFSFINSDQVRVYFINPFEQTSAKFNDFPLATLKGYAYKQMRHAQALAFPADILLQRFEMLKNLGLQGEVFRRLYIEQLVFAKTNRPDLYQYALLYQNSQDLKAIADSIQREFNDLNDFKILTPDLLDKKPSSTDKYLDKIQEELSKLYLTYTHSVR